MIVYALVPIKLQPALNKIDGRIVYNSRGELFITEGYKYRLLMSKSILVDNEVVEELTDLQYTMFYKIATKYVTTQGYK